VVIKTDSLGNITPVTGIPDPVNLKGIPHVSIFPNPFSTAATIQFEVNENCSVRVEFFNPATGIKVKIFENEVAQGIFSIQINASNLAQITNNHGLCYCLLWVNNHFPSAGKCIIF